MTRSLVAAGWGSGLAADDAVLLEGEGFGSGADEGGDVVAAGGGVVAGCSGGGVRLPRFLFPNSLFQKLIRSP